MSFLKFLKRGKGNEPDLGLENMDHLDVPPPPPGVGGKDFGAGKGLPELPELPDMPEAEGLSPEMQEKPLPELKIPPMQEFPDPNDVAKMPAEELQDSMPEFPEFEEEAEAAPRRPVPSIGKPKVGFPKRMADVGVQKPGVRPYKRFEMDAIREERAVLEHKETKGPIFIRVDNFRGIIGGTSVIKNNLKTAGQLIVKLNEIDANRDNVLEKWRKVMTDLQKKLIFIDKILFKGD